MAHKSFKIRGENSRVFSHLEGGIQELRAAVRADDADAEQVARCAKLRVGESYMIQWGPGFAEIKRTK